MQNIVFQYKMVLDDCFFFFSYPIVPSNPSGKKRRSRTSYNFSAAAAVTVKLGVVGQNRTQQNIQTTS